MSHVSEDDTVSNQRSGPFEGVSGSETMKDCGDELHRAGAGERAFWRSLARARVEDR